MHKITNIYKKSTIIPNRTCNLFICDCKTQEERYSGSCSRSFYVGDSIRDNDIQASFKDGILTITVPTEEHKEETEKKYIDIL